MEFYFLELPSYISLVICGFVGLIFLIIHFSNFELSFNISNKLILLSCSSVLLQVLVVVYYTQNNEIGSFSLFYNIVNLFILTFLYIYLFAESQFLLHIAIKMPRQEGSIHAIWSPHLPQMSRCDFVKFLGRGGGLLYLPKSQLAEFRMLRATCCTLLKKPPFCRRGLKIQK